jgi:hypothetical protein
MNLLTNFLFILISVNAAYAFSSVTSPSLLAKVNVHRNINTYLNANRETDERLSQTFNGYTVKQRLREEVESPFRKVRLLFFASSCGSALTALYFSLSALGYSDAIPLDEALTSCAINISGAIVCGLLAYREYKAGEQNLERIARGGKLAKLGVTPADDEKVVIPLADYRRKARVLICAGGKEYIERICRSLNADQLADTNNLSENLKLVGLIVVPVLLTGEDGQKLATGDTKACWRSTIPAENDRNFESSRSDEVVSFPWGNGPWTEYLQSEIETAKSQGFDVLENGITLLVKKNGKILRRATGMPRWGDLVGTMEVMDGSKFGMPGDSEKYGGL